MEAVFHQDKTFEKINYAGQVVHDREFENCTFKRCDFTGSQFAGCRFHDCTFEGCNLAMIKLNRSTLNNVVFTECKLTGINFSECEDMLFTVKFDTCILDYASFMRKKMPGTRFTSSSLKEVVFSQANLEKAVFDNSNLERAIFNQTQLKSADFVTAYNFDIDPEFNNIKNARFSQYGLPGLLTKHDLRVE
ncbi:pentapeptide repeat-containing protein [Pontibacter qinzhouensis]|uniref:Pentapeptide repeat-containing protein n=1 Tax=Pontibacter qinzhouensis TaxID=2603253 RepID=A0A5C8K4Z5_9BACT|nr:pentapeptide repeat-containing protein [Pontibacter qinzhouensis]TXK44287.1 pentapeptide repeat-containing protein [Pontibacter qinzhouensis]